ncbi:hypothetical protein BV898_05573 [Hypsibius exemplaris]|uniref:Uncharacterized protein n=1 Tax=Hypsibius exemplaris TaxID=2072580 RepID=A0A1W0WZB0_HYPEX|nr:hypothetical protein BV898_05573 [Hypsibius exemplaris]
MAPINGDSLTDDNGPITASPTDAATAQRGSGSHSSSSSASNSADGGGENSEYPGNTNTNSNTNTNTNTNHGTASSRLGDLADEAAKKVDEFSALLADVESRTRNQRVLLERHYENMEYGEMGGTMTLQQEGAGGKRPTNLLIGLSNGQRTLPLMTSSHSLNKLKVDELMDFGPLSKKLKKNAVAADLSSPSHANTSVSSPANNINTRNPYTNSGIPSGRRFSTFAASLPRSTQQQQQYGRKSSVQLTSSPSVSHYSRLHSDTALTTTTPSFLPLSVSVSTGGDSSSSPPGHPSGKVNGESSLSPSSTPQQQQTVGGLVKLFSESAVIQGSNALDNVSDKDSAGRKKPIPPPLRPLTDSNSARLLVRGPEKVVFCSDPISPLANGPPLSPRVTSPVPNNPYLSVNDAANGKRSPSPSFSNSFFFGRNGGNGGGNSCERAVPETRPMSPLVGIHSLGEREQATKRSGSPSGSASSFPNPFAFARKLSGAFVSSDSSDGTVGKERSKGAKGDQQRALSPPAAMAPVLTNGKSDGTAVSPYAILKKPSEQLVIKQKQTVFQRRGSANPSGSSSSKTTLTKTVSHSNNNNSNGQPTANLPNVVYRSTSHLTLPTTEHRSIGSPISPPKTDTTPDSRSSSPSSFFGFSKSPKKDKQSSDNTNRPTDNSSSSGLERLLAGLNFSKFRITTGNTTPAAADKSGMGPSSNSQAPQTTTAVMPARGGAVPQLGQQLPQQQSKHEPNERLNRLGREVQTQASSSQARSSFMTRTVSQPTGLSVNQQETATGLGPSASAAVVQLRRDRPRVTVSEDRINLSSVGGGGCGSGVSEAGASSERVSEDIATLITDIRQHFQLSRMGASVGAGGGGGGGGGKRNGGCDGLSQLHQSVANSSALTATVSVDDQGKNELSEGGAESTCPESNRDSDYVVSLVSDGDYSESTTGHDGNGEFDTESTSSSFIFSPATSSAGSASRAATAGALERDSQLISGAIQTGPTGTEMYPPEKTQPAAVSAVSKKPIDGSLYATTTTTKTTVICAAAAGTPYSRASSVERSMTFPPSVGRKTSATILPQDSISDMKYNDSQSTTHDGPNTVTAGLDDDPEHRLSSASFPESAVSDSLTDSVYSTAGSTSLSSYIHHHCCSSSSDTASFLSDSSSYVRPTPLETGVVRVGKPRYHSDPMTVAVSGPLLTGSTTASTTNTTGTCTCITPQASSISEPIHLLPVAACGATAIATATAAGGTAAQCPPAVVAETVSSSASALPGKTAVAGIIPHGLKEVVIRESGGQFFGIVSSDQQQQLDGRNGGAMPKIADAATALQQKDYRSDSFRRSEKRLPRGPFGARLEEDQLRREHQQQQQQRQLIQDLSFLHDSPASTPGIPELSPSLPIHIDTETVEKITKGRRQSAALPTGQPDSRLVSRQYTAVRSSPDLYRTSSVGGVASPLSPLGGLRVSGGGHDICRSVSDAQASSWKRIAEESIGGGSDSAVYSGSSDSVVPTESSGGSSSGGGSHISSKGVTAFVTSSCAVQ